MADLTKFYVIWTGALALGDTPGVFNDGQFVGLLVSLPVTVGYQGTADPVELLLLTTEVEIYGGKTHPVLWDWEPGHPLANQIGEINDQDPVPGKPEYHLLTVPRRLFTEGRHTVTVVVNPEVPAGMRDDFVLRAALASEAAGIKIGW